jgi:hypothetical protein
MSTHGSYGKPLFVGTETKIKRHKQNVPRTANVKTFPFTWFTSFLLDEGEAVKLNVNPAYRLLRCLPQEPTMKG